MTDLIHQHLGVSDAIYEELLKVVPKAIIDSLGEKSPNEVKAKAIDRVFGTNDLFSDILEIEYTDKRWNAIALIGMMVEQAYNSAVLANKKPLFGAGHKRRETR